MAPVELLPYDTADYLNTDRECLAFLNVALEEGDLFDVASALGAIARAKGLAEAAEAAGLDRYSLYREGDALTNPLGYDTLARVIQVLGFQLQAIRPRTHSPSR